MRCHRFFYKLFTVLVRPASFQKPLSVLWGFPALTESVGSLSSPACRAGNRRASPPPRYIVPALAQGQRSVPSCILQMRRQRAREPGRAGTWDGLERGAGGPPCAREKAPASPAPLAALRPRCPGDPSSAFGGGGRKAFPFSFTSPRENFSLLRRPSLRVPPPPGHKGEVPAKRPSPPRTPGRSGRRGTVPPGGWACGPLPAKPSRVGAPGRYSRCCCARTSAPWLGCAPHPR